MCGHGGLGLIQGISKAAEHKRLKRQNTEHNNRMGLLTTSTDKALANLRKEWIDDGKSYFFQTSYSEPTISDEIFYKTSEGTCNGMLKRQTRVCADPFFMVFNSNGNLYSESKDTQKNNSKISSMGLYIDGYRKIPEIKINRVKAIMSSEEFIVLYQDESYLKNCTNEKFALAYLMDENSFVEFDDLRKKDKCRRYVLKEMSPMSALYTYGKHFEEGTKIFTKLEGETTYAEFVLNHTSIDGLKYKILSKSEAMYERKKYEKPEECIVGQAVTKYIRKKALIIWGQNERQNQRIVGILLLKKEEYNACRIHYWLDKPVSVHLMDYDSLWQKVDQNAAGKRIDEIDLMNVDKESTIASTMDYIVSKLSPSMLPPDVTEAKPEGLSNENWRYWITKRYELRKKCIAIER